MSRFKEVLDIASVCQTHYTATLKMIQIQHLAIVFIKILSFIEPLNNDNQRGTLKSIITKVDDHYLNS